MAMEGIRLDDGGSRRNWPLMVPRALLEAYQPLIGPTATVLWLNLYNMTEETGPPRRGAANGRSPGAGLLEELARRMGVSTTDVQRAWAALEGAGLLRRAPGGWVLAWPAAAGVDEAELAVAAAGDAAVMTGAGGFGAPRAHAPSLEAPSFPSYPGAMEPAWEVGSPAAPAYLDDEAGGSTGQAPGLASPAAAAPPSVPAGGGGMAAAAPAVPGGAAASGQAPAGGTGGAPAASGRKESLEAALGAVVAFYHQRIGLLGPSQFERLRFWVEEQGMSPEVVALAIEETVQSARTPRMNYLEGILRNWYNEGIRCLEDLQRTQRARAIRPAAPVEGAPNAGAYRPVDAEAVRRWKEMFADEYDG